MTNTKYTPGPWKAVQHPHEHKWAWTIEGADEGGQSIARMGLVNDAKAVAANAHLIAAAPAMYALLKRAAISLQEYCAEINGDMNESLACEIEATIAQAEGVSHE